MQHTTPLTKWILSVLILFGALVACSPAPTPIAVATATIIPSTETATPIPLTPSSIPPATSTPINLSTQSSIQITPILETDVELNIDFTREVMAALASYLGIPENRVQLVSIESTTWDSTTIGCYDDNTGFFDAVTVSSTIGESVDGLRYVLLVGDMLYEYHTIGTGNFVRCPGREIMSGEVLVAVDPLAAETLRVVQNQLGSELDLSSRRVQLVDMMPVIWEDTSLGCPQEGQTYTETEIPGYHIVVTVGDELYVYHSDSNTAYPCPLEQSIIPVSTPQ